jgi:hypothetical protein
MKRVYAPLRGVLAKALDLTDWDIVNSHPALLVQLCWQYSLSYLLLTDYVTRRDSWISLVINTVNKFLAKASASAEEPASKKKAPPALNDTKGANNLFIRILYLGGTGEWSKEVGFKGSIPKVEDLRLELKRIGKGIVKHFPALHQVVMVVAHDAEVCESNNPLSRVVSLIMGDIENKCLMAAIEYIESLGLAANVLVYDGFMVHGPEEQIRAEKMSEWVFEATGYRVQ